MSESSSTHPRLVPEPIPTTATSGFVNLSAASFSPGSNREILTLPPSFPAPWLNSAPDPSGTAKSMSNSIRYLRSRSNLQEFDPNLSRLNIDLVNSSEAVSPSYIKPETDSDSAENLITTDDIQPNKDASAFVALDNVISQASKSQNETGSLSPRRPTSLLPSHREFTGSYSSLVVGSDYFRFSFFKWSY
ncbi:unnamed protein product [Protopolystoma xenopodis]|uniref:Uncharacterized protein n=1 Tax=Protopolystoma xenopodis TaxID=117903 RepID=A0A3S5CI42_9PLAT|nr:unnamed protein product [Protopolystoma xenopodis]